MPSSFPSKVRHNYDAETALQPLDSAPVTEAGPSENVFDLESLRDAYWDNGEVPLQTFAVVIWVDEVSADTQWSIEVSETEDFATPYTVFDSGVQTRGYFVANLDGPTLNEVTALARYIRVVVEPAEGESIKYGAWVAPSVRTH